MQNYVSNFSMDCPKVLFLVIVKKKKEKNCVVIHVEGASRTISIISLKLTNKRATRIDFNAAL